jgi:Tfp pilus assembly protein PilX
MRGRQSERGAVSIFIVIFTALLITTITVAFVRTMVQDQQQATMNDLSKSALDSAQAGVEDAKRAIVTYQSHCIESGDGVGTTECNNLASALRDGTHCDTLQKAGVAGSPDDKEVVIKQAEGDELLQQAYTCVKVQLDTKDFIGSVTPNTSRLIPLKASGAFNQIVIEWYSQSDLQTAAGDNPAGGATPVDLGLDARLPKLADWPKNRPALMRVQLLQFGDSFKLSDFYGTADASNANDASLFLVPSRVGRTTMSFSDDIRQSSTSGALEQIACNPNFSSTSTDTQYACKATIQLPNPIDTADAAKRHAYLRVNELYNTNTNFRVTLQDASSNPVSFSSVQPLVDATGRANDLFRRIQSRIELTNSSIPYTEATVDLTNSLCKSFLVTDKPEDYNPGNCSGN